MSKRYLICKNAVIATSGALEKIIELDLRYHRPKFVGAADAFEFAVQFNKSDTTSSISITWAWSIDGIFFVPGTAFAGSAGTPTFQDVLIVTGIKGWDTQNCAVIPGFLKITVTEGGAGPVSDLDVSLVAC